MSPNPLSTNDKLAIEYNKNTIKSFHLKVLAHIIDDLDLTVYERDLLTFIAHKTIYYKKNYDALSQNYIANKRNMSSAQVKKTMSALENKGYIFILSPINRRGKGVEKFNRYGVRSSLIQQAFEEAQEFMLEH